ncbi:PREDICTED: uncharacterized protein LOC109217066 [Nicotiana attenuata]|uniref:uncharacterized protein LOC109217066 n=1 Tax=Nicotiana attenuata TaxID=49451 RepID=UPI000904D3D2|nr:PREDICTED: uncharacterized protein LOC109217066 [Nicotiana attenuata]
MARKSRNRGGSQQIHGSQTSNSVCIGVPQSADAKKLKSINSIQGIIPLDVNQISNPTTPKGTSEEITMASRASWADRADEEEKMSKSTGLTKTLDSSPKTWSNIMGTIPMEEGLDLISEVTEQNVKITMADIKDEVDYWTTAVVCYVLGSNPPQVVIDGYFRRIWGAMGIDKVAQLNRGVFLVRFHSIESRSKAVEEGVQMFDRKPVIVKPWKPDMEITKEQMKNISIWVRLVGLDIKYWGQAALTKIAGLIGQPLKADAATTNRDRLIYARVLVEVKLNQQYPTSIRFENEIGKIIEQEIHYEWKPVLCGKCKNYGHDIYECRRYIQEEKEKQQTIQKQEVQQKEKRGEIREESNDSQEVPLKIGNTFDTLGQQQAEDLASTSQSGLQVVTMEKGMGLNNPDRQKDINLFMHNSQVRLFGLLETKVKRAKAQKAALNLCNGWSYSTNLSQYNGGRIWLLWKPMVYDISICKVTEQLIHYRVHHRGDGRKFSVTMVYAFNDAALRRKLWEDIKEINDQMAEPWAIMGDFNCVLHKEDMIGSPITMAEIREFKECVTKCILEEMKSSGAFYTWNNKQGGTDRVYSRIDRVLINNDWILTMPDSEVFYRSEGTYDHCPAIIRLAEIHKKQHIFRYFNMWSIAPSYKETMKQGWNTNKRETKMYD